MIRMVKADSPKSPILVVAGAVPHWQSAGWTVDADFDGGSDLAQSAATVRSPDGGSTFELGDGTPISLGSGDVTQAELDQVAEDLAGHATSTAAHGITDLTALITAQALGYYWPGRVQSHEHLNNSASLTVTNGVLFLSYMQPIFDTTGLSYFQSLTNVAKAGGTLTRLGLFEVGATDLTLLAESDDVTATAMAVGDSPFEVPFSTARGMPASVDMFRSTRYAVGIVAVGQTTAGRLRSNYTTNASRWNPVACKQAVGPFTDLPATLAKADLSDLNVRPYFSVSDVPQG